MKQPNTITATVQAAMKRLGLSVAELSRRADIPRPNLSAWLNGRADMNVRTLERVIAALDLRIR